MGWRRGCLEGLQGFVRAIQPQRPSSRFTTLLEAVVIDWPNEAAESTSPRIQWVKRMACGCRNRSRFRNAMHSHLGGLDLNPRPVSTHTIS